MERHTRFAAPQESTPKTVFAMSINPGFSISLKFFEICNNYGIISMLYSFCSVLILDLEVF